MEQQQLSFWDFVCRWADPEGLIAGKFAPHFRFADEPETPFVLCLMRNASQHFPGTSKCVFLRETPSTPEHPLGTAECSIYHQRPGTCRVFPMTFDDAGSPRFRDVGGCHGGGEPHVYQLCPRKWEAADIEPAAALRALRRVSSDMTFFHQLAEAWNRRPLSWLVFPEFLQIVYQQVAAAGNADDVAEAA
jgi:hypothetical protein